MNLIEAIILGVLQGLTEFLPVSSSGHLLVFGKLFNFKSSFEFDVLINFGSLLAVVIFYRKKFWTIIKNVLKRDLRYGLLLILATIPTVVVGYIFEDVLTRYTRNVVVCATMLLLIGLLMIHSNKWKSKQLLVNKNSQAISLKQALLIGLAQPIALISGSSRSGVTILAAQKLGFKMAAATEWSFMMAVPIIFGASLKVLLGAEGQVFVRQNLTIFLVGNIASFISGILAIRLFMDIVKKRGLYWFGWYRVGLATLLFIILLIQ